MNSHDVIIIGAGIIGLSLAIELRKQGLSVLIVEKGEPGREASWAAGGMLAASEIPALFQTLAIASARMYPEFVHELEDESGRKIDLRAEGTLLFEEQSNESVRPAPTSPMPAQIRSDELSRLERAVTGAHGKVVFLQERCVDPRDLVSAAIVAARHRGVNFSSGDRVSALELADGKACGVRTNKTQFASSVVVNCAGAWAGEIGPHRFPTRPVKGQMLCVAMPEKTLLRHVIRTPDVYLIPRSDGRLLIGATQEEAGFDKKTVPATVQKLRQSAIDLVPTLAEARILEAWAGLRPGTPDDLPILGATSTPGYFVATGHFRDGILLAPITARVTSQLITGQAPDLDLAALSPQRFMLTC